MVTLHWFPSAAYSLWESLHRLLFTGYSNEVEMATLRRATERVVRLSKRPLGSSFKQYFSLKQYFQAVGHISSSPS